MKYLPGIFIIILFISGCGKLSDEDYMNKADESVKQNNIDDALQAYESLIKEYPESELVPSALFKMAQVYQYKQSKNLSKNESLQKAIDTFKKIYADFPESKEAANSLFMLGFIYANEVEDYNEATRYYKLFLEKFPEHELAASAEAEIKNMGVPAEEILENKTLTEK